MITTLQASAFYIATKYGCMIMDVAHAVYCNVHCHTNSLITNFIITKAYIAIPNSEDYFTNVVTLEVAMHVVSCTFFTVLVDS